MQEVATIQTAGQPNQRDLGACAAPDDDGPHHQRIEHGAHGDAIEREAKRAEF